jgi:hypothetical protein
MTFYRGSLTKFLQFLGNRSDDPMAEDTKQDVVAFRNSLITQPGSSDSNTSPTLALTAYVTCL